MELSVDGLFSDTSVRMSLVYQMPVPVLRLPHCCGIYNCYYAASVWLGISNNRRGLEVGSASPQPQKRMQRRRRFGGKR